MCLFAFCSLIAALQPPRADVNATPGIFSADYWIHPVEQNASERLPTIREALFYRHNLPDSNKAWAVGDGGTIVATQDGGKTWAPQTSHTEQHLRSVSFVGATTGWAVGDSGTILATQDGGKTWAPQTSHTEEVLWSVSFVGATTGWAVGEGGTILATQDGGKTWAPQTSHTEQNLWYVSFVSATTGWAVGTNGTIQATQDGGKTWAPQTSHTEQSLDSVSFASATNGWAVGDGGTILATQDGGKTWGDPRVYRSWPAPWYYVSLIPVFLLLAFALRKRIAPPVENAIEDILASDRPLDSPADDRLGFQSIALGISRFLRNQRTQPPLTIAITGAWGVGKSSLMGLLCADLKKAGYCTVWFNAWHHQQEDQLLAALLENIREQAIPSLFSAQGVPFHLRLLRVRSRRYAPHFFLWLLAISVSVGFFCAHPERIAPDTAALRKIGATMEKPEARAREGAEEKPGGGQESGGGKLSKTLDAVADATTVDHGFASLGILGILGLLAAGLKAMRAFGVNPASLLVTATAGARIRDLEDKTGFRFRFARDFGEVAEAMKPHNITIVVDDLDRCRADQVLAILEAVNFLVSSGDCYIVIGMAVDRVEHAVALQFKEIAEEESLSAPAAAAADAVAAAAKEARTQYARNYLEKLVNIEIPIPSLEPDKTAKLLLNEQTQPTAAEARRNFRARIAAGVPSAALRLALTAVLAGSFVMGYGVQIPTVTPSPPPTAPPFAAASPSSTATARIPTHPTATPPTKPTPTLAPADAGAVVTPGQPASYPWAIPTSIFLAAAVVASWMLVLRQMEQFQAVRDSPRFHAAVNKWEPLVSFKSRTPRSLKRFMNRVRYLAMLQRPPEPVRDTPWNRMTGAYPPSLPDADARPKSTDIPEGVLVALATIQHCYPDALESALPLQSYLKAQPLSPLEQAFFAEYRTWKLLEKYRLRFLEMSRGLRVR